MSQSNLPIYATPPHDCSYLPNTAAVNAVIDPQIALNPSLYARLINLGFRRSGSYIYRPHCGDCKACIATRIDVRQFKPNRSQRRCWQRNQDLTVRMQPAAITDEYFSLYKRYIDGRHAGGGMDNPTPDSFEDFLISSWCNTHFVEFRQANRLLCVAVVDVLPQGYSSVYTFFDPDEKQRGLGTQAILWQVNTARNRDIPWVYLGYWISESDKMRYKTQFQPLEGFQNAYWRKIKNP